MKQFNTQFATQRLLQEQQGPFYVVYNKGYGQGKGVANDFKSFPSFEAAQAFADEANNSTSGTFSKFQKYYYVVGSDHEDFEWISQAAHDKAGLDKEIGETLNEVKFTIDDSDLYSAVMDRYMRGASVQDMLIKDEGDYLETDEETFQGIQAIAMDLDKVDALIRLDGIEETSTTSGAGAYLPKATVKKKTDEVKKNKKDVEPKLAAGPADIYMKKKWGWKEAPSIPNRESDMFDYTELWPNKKLNENYSRFKKETKTRTNEQQLHAAMRLAEKKIHEANRILEYTAQLRTELTETKVNKNTQKLMEKITRGIAEAYGKMKKLK